jgi:signal transduction histidine kinase
VTKLWLAIGGLLVLSVGSAGLAAIAIVTAERQAERIALARDQYELLLRLESRTYRLFKQYGDAIAIGDRDEGAGERELIAQIRAILRELRATVGDEIELVGEEEVDELETIAAISLKIENLVRALEGVSDPADGRDAIARFSVLSRILDRDIDQEFRALIDGALAEEAEEVRETEAEVHATMVRLQALVLALAALSAAAALGAAVLIRRSVTRPAERLIEGARRLGEGRLDHRIALEGHDELAQVGATFDRMAERLAAQTRELETRAGRLDAELAERNARLETLLGEARRAEALRRRLLADVSHELRTPLTIIRGEADIALRGPDKEPEAYREALRRAREAAAHTAQLVDDLLMVARTESGEVRLKPEEIDLAALLGDVVGTYGGGAALDAEPGARLRADPGRLRQALLVLLDNARRHGGGRLWVRLHRTPEGMAIDVEDDGPGLGDEEKELAFERFFRGSNAAETYAEGTGLGLPIARAIARAHGGEVTLADRHGGGLVARLTLPDRPPLRAVS